MSAGILYFADPMCSWCWGFAPVMRRIEDFLGDRASVELCMGGLSVGEKRPLDKRTKESIRHHWEHVQELTGQTFDYAFFERENFVYETSVPSRAVVLARQLRPSAGLAFLEAIHAAFYRDNRDVTREDVAVTVAEEFGFQRREFAARLASEEIACATLRDHALARATGITGFPSVLGRSADGDVAALTIGYQSFEALMPMMTSWLKTASIGGAGRARANRV